MLRGAQILVAEFRKSEFSLRVIHLRLSLLEGCQSGLCERAVGRLETAADFLASNLDPGIVDAA